MAELIAGILLVAGALYLVLKPVFQPRFAEVGKGDGGSVEGGEDPDDDLSPGAVALRALKEIEFDRATGKLSDTDYDALKAEYTAAALAALRAEAGTRVGPAPAAQRAPAVAEPTPVPSRMRSSVPSVGGDWRRRPASALAAAPRSSATRGTVTPAARGSPPDLTPLTSFLPGRLYRSTGSSDPCLREETLSHAQHVPTHSGRRARRACGRRLQRRRYGAALRPGPGARGRAGPARRDGRHQLRHCGRGTLGRPGRGDRHDRRHGAHLLGPAPRGPRRPAADLPS